ncbi:hypothetical protein L7F22_051067 [Adiantum nelumboides]|nr:hypothetical protein [Adiantum nelumboides]
MEETLVFIDSVSNNESEFDILILGLKACISRGIKRLMVKGDALLVVKQVMGVWACKSEKLKGKVRVIRSLLSQFSDVQLYHIPRKENQQANDLAQRAVKEVITLAAASLKPPRFEGLEALAPIVSYILEGEFPPGLTSLQRKRLIKQASSYLWLDGVLYQKGKDLVCRRVPSCKEIPLILKSLHEEACGGHFAHDLTARKILHAGYVWPTLHLDVQHWCRTCHQCQINGDRRLIHDPRHPVVANGPFEKRGIDAIGRLPRTANGKLYIFVAIDYMTKWVEAQSISRVTKRTVTPHVKAGGVGFCYGRFANNLPSPENVASLLVMKSITKIRIFDNDQSVIQAFANMDIELMIGIPNGDLADFQTEAQADAWVASYLVPMVTDTKISIISVGSEVVTDYPAYTPFLLPAMKNIHTGLAKAGLSIQVTTANSMAILQDSFPPSAAVFNQSFGTSFMKPLLDYLHSIGSFVMINAYPYLAYT